MSMAGPEGASAAAGAGEGWPCASRLAPAAAMPTQRRARRLFMVFSSTRRARGWVPPARVHWLEMRAGPVRRCQIFGVDDLGGHNQQRVATGYVETVEVFRHHSVRAVGNAVLPQIPRLHAGRDDFERATAHLRAAPVRNR